MRKSPAQAICKAMALLTLLVSTQQPLHAKHDSDSSSSSSSSSYHPTSLLGSWQPLANQPNFLSYDFTDPSHPISTPGGVMEARLLTDGSVIVQNNGYWGTPEFWKLTPDEFGSYVNGTWSQAASLSFIPTYTAGAVLADGRLILCGGEYLDWDFNIAYSNKCALYDPVQDAWTAFDGPPFFTNLAPRSWQEINPNPLGDGASVVLEDGTFMVEDPLSFQSALLDLKTLTWKPTGAVTKSPHCSNEEGLILLPDGKVLTVNCYAETLFLHNMYPRPPADALTDSQIYDPKTGEWKDAGSTIVSLVAFAEIGPGILRPDGTVFQVGGNGNTAIYDSKTGQWMIGPQLPIGPGQEGQLGCADGPGALLPNGTVLFAASPQTSGNSGPPVHFFIFDGTTLVEQPTIPNATLINPSIGAPDGSWSTHLLVLPTGQVLLNDFSNDVEIYTPNDRSYDKNWAPVIHKWPKKVYRGNTYKIEGVRFNGMSQASMYGDESQCATNYPLVRITNCETGHVRYCRTHDHSFMGVASDKEVHTYFDVPNDIDPGKSKLEVVANGIPSKPMDIYIHHHNH